MIFGRIIANCFQSSHQLCKVILPILLQMKKLTYSAGRLTTLHSKQIIKSEFEFRFSSTKLGALWTLVELSLLIILAFSFSP